LAGSGAIKALGGSITGAVSLAGAGGGGRIAIYYSAITYTGTYSANPGNGSDHDGESGSIFIQDVSGGPTSGDIFCNINGSASFNPNDALTISIHDITISNGCLYKLSIAPGATSGSQITANNINIAPGSSLNADGQGYLGGRYTGSLTPGFGPGGGTGYSFGTGGGYGGAGARSSTVNHGGSTYGSSTQPTSLGSGGGSGSAAGRFGGAGGGAIKLIVNGTLTVNGILSANGAPGYTATGYSTYGGGGSGGSIWIQTGILAGGGLISAYGASNIGTNFTAGAGGGGRIAIYYNTKTFSGKTSAKADQNSDISPFAFTSTYQGGDGTIYWKLNSQFKPFFFRSW
jgi:hypothetical protein